MNPGEVHGSSLDDFCIWGASLLLFQNKVILGKTPFDYISRMIMEFFFFLSFLGWHMEIPRLGV